MKKTLTTLAAVVALSFGASAQYQYMEHTPYKGAFAPAPTPMWTDGWTEWNPGTKSYPATTAEISSNITSDFTLTNDKVWLLKNKVYVTNGAKLTIQPGTIIRGDKSTAGTIIISRGSKIYAWGTQKNPIVFTSNFDQGLRNPGDWGGLIILGNATMNQTVPQVVEGGLDETLGAYGGTNDDDNSGIIQYVRIEFAGFPFAPDKEINGLTLGAVGKNTVIDHVQASYTNDDSFEWFGGAVDARFLVAFAGTDDDFDTDFGFHGSVQFGLALRDPQYSDQCTCSSSEGFESDNDGSGTDATPFTSAKFANITVLGPLRGNIAAVVNSKNQRALRIRRNSALSIYNSVFTDWPKGLLLDGDKTAQKAKDGILEFKGNVIAGVASAPVATNAATTIIANQAALDAWYTAGGNSKEATSANLFTNPFPGDINTPGDFRPKAGSSLLTAGVDLFQVQTFDANSPKTTDFVGAFAPAPKPMWTEGWTNYNPGTTAYPATNAEISTNITSDFVLTNDKVWLLKNKVYVTNGATLIIQPGTIIRGDKSTAGTLIISKGSKIHAMGTKDMPIVFTSNFDQGLRNPGDFGGILILGNAPINQVGSQVVEGGLDETLASYGGTMEDEYSGVMQYVRIEFGGFPFAPDKEINGLTLAGVGRTTAIHHIQCSYTNDDSFEWFGGSVNAKYLVAFAGTDDDFDTDFGFNGHVQYGLGLRDPQYSDQCTCSSSEGFESDNDGTGTDANPRTSPYFYNMTMVGPLRGATTAVNTKYQRALRIRRNSQLSSFNSIYMEWPKGLLLDGDKTAQRAKDGQLKFQGNIIAGMASAPVATNAAAGVLTSTELNTWFASNKNATLATSAGLLENPFPGDINVAGDFRFKGDLQTILAIQDEMLATLSTEAMIVFPNPANENVQIALNSEFANATVTVQNAMGMTVASSKAFGESVKFDVSGFANGLYIVSATNGGNSISKTLLINR